MVLSTGLRSSESGLRLNGENGGRMGDGFRLSPEIEGDDKLLAKTMLAISYERRRTTAVMVVGGQG